MCFFWGLCAFVWLIASLVLTLGFWYFGLSCFGLLAHSKGQIYTTTRKAANPSHSDTRIEFEPKYIVYNIYESLNCRWTAMIVDCFTSLQAPNSNNCNVVLTLVEPYCYVRVVFVYMSSKFLTTCVCIRFYHTDSIVKWDINYKILLIRGHLNKSTLYT